MTDLLLSQIKPGAESQFGTDEYVVNMGPQHPATHGVLRLMVKLDGETVKETMPVLGYLHRSIEKICENRTYPQCITYTDRVDYVSAMSVNLAFALATERLMGLEAPAACPVASDDFCGIATLGQPSLMDGGLCWRHWRLDSISLWLAGT